MKEHKFFKYAKRIFFILRAHEANKLQMYFCGNRNRSLSFYLWKTLKIYNRTNKHNLRDNMIFIFFTYSKQYCTHLQSIIIQIHICTVPVIYTTVSTALFSVPHTRQWASFSNTYFRIWNCLHNFWTLIIFLYYTLLELTVLCVSPYFISCLKISSSIVGYYTVNT